MVHIVAAIISIILEHFVNSLREIFNRIFNKKKSSSEDANMELYVKLKTSMQSNKEELQEIEDIIQGFKCDKHRREGNLSRFHKHMQF